MSSTFDPVRHDNHVIGLFGTQAAGERAHAAVLSAGLDPDLVSLMADGDALHRGDPHPIQDLFVPEDDYHDYHHALGRGYAMVVVRPTTAIMRDTAVRALEASDPLDVQAHGREWRGHATAPAGGPSINHANVSRADMLGRAVGGHDEVMLDMTGQKMTVRSMSDPDMAAAPFARWADPADRPAPLAPPVPERAAPVSGTSYTYGVPADVVARMSPDEQVMAQPHTVEVPGDHTARGSYLRTVSGETRMGWRDPHPEATTVRSYLTERSSTL